MDPTLSPFLFTSAGAVAIFLLGAVALAALPWSLAQQASTERGLEHGAQVAWRWIIGWFPSDPWGGSLVLSAVRIEPQNAADHRRGPPGPC